MTYRVVHRTSYRYESEVHTTYGEARLHPRDTTRQRCYATTLAVDPFPEEYRLRRDYFGNRVAHYALLEPHTELVVTATSVVDVSPTPGPADDGPPWVTVRDALAGGGDAELLDARQYVLASPAVAASAGAADYAAASFADDRPVLAAVADLSSRIHADFEFRPGATDVDTTVDELLERGAGVCQDFAHLAIAGLRSVGLAARYVSGYLETTPPPGQDRLVGADVSHAWVSVFVPDQGWVDVDPTNDGWVDQRYVTLAWGRDYADVPPLKGVIFTEGAGHHLEVSVDVTPLADDDPALAGNGSTS